MSICKAYMLFLWEIGAYANELYEFDMNKLEGCYLAFKNNKSSGKRPTKTRIITEELTQLLSTINHL